MRVRLTRLNNFGNALRTDSVDGELLIEPTVGLPLILIGEPLDPTMAVREVTTSAVVRIEGDEVWTQNTHYRLEFLHEGHPEDVERYYWEEKKWREQREETDREPT